MVPVIRNVNGMSFTDIEKAINLLGEKVTYLTFFMYFDGIFGFLFHV